MKATAHPKFKIRGAIDHRFWLRFPASAVFDERLTRQQLRTLAAICLHLDENYRTFVGQAAIARILGISRQAAGTHCRALLTLGLVRRIASRRQGFIQEVVFIKPKIAALSKASGIVADPIKANALDLARSEASKHLPKDIRT